MEGAKTEASVLLQNTAPHETRQWKITYAVLCLAFMVDRANEFAGEGLGRAFEEDFDATPNALSLLSLSGAVALACCSPIWGYFADLYPRTRLLSIGCAFWSLFTFCAVFAQRFWVIVVFRALAGTMLGAVRPNGLGLVADTVPFSAQGASYGILLASASFGATCCSEMK